MEENFPAPELYSSSLVFVLGVSFRFALDAVVSFSPFHFAVAV